MLRGVVRSLRAIGFARLLIVNGHGGNVEPLAVAARELAHEFGLPVVATTPWYLTRDKIGDIAETAETPAHACEGETSVMMAVAPDLVRTDKFDEAVRQRPEPTPKYDGLSRFWSFSERAPVTGRARRPAPGDCRQGRTVPGRPGVGVGRRHAGQGLWRARRTRSGHPTAGRATRPGTRTINAGRAV